MIPERYTGRPKFLEEVVSPDWFPALGIPKVLEYKTGLKGIEIGSCFGGSTHYLLDTLPDSHITAIDPYIDYDQMHDRDHSFRVFKQLMEMYPDRITLIRELSDDAFDKIEDDSVDFIFIDGYHSNEQVAKDIENYYPKLKSGGLLCGHDYQAWGLSPSVNEAAEKYKKEVKFCDQDVWYWFK